MGTTNLDNLELSEDLTVAGDVTVAGTVSALSVVSDDLEFDTSAIVGFAAAGDTAGADVYCETQDAGAGATAARKGAALSIKMGDGSAGAAAVAGGAGGALTLAGGIGGATTGSGTAGTGGAAALSAGAGAANSGGAGGGIGGAGGAASLVAGAGAATNSAGAHAAGAGGSVAITAGVGGNATAGTGNGGAGGSITLTTGTGGSTTGGSAGARGQINFHGRANRYLAGASAAGVCLDHLGPNAVEGVETFVLDETVACAAAENAMTAAVPKGAIIDAVLANCQAALTGGGTTATWSLGITGNVDLYGTAGYPTQSDSLAKNSKSSMLLAGTELAAAETIKVCAAATGGAAAGNTALTVGSVRVVVIYRAAAALASV